MKKEQFTHNLAKVKRQAEAQRNQQVNPIFRDMFASWSVVFNNDENN